MRLTMMMALALAGGFAACNGQLAVDDRPCPCGDGYVCCDDVCVTSAQGCNGSDAGGDVRTGPGASGISEGGASDDGRLAAQDTGTVGYDSGWSGNPSDLLAPTPGRVRCGPTTCDAKAEFCCLGDDHTFRCSATFCGLRRECDEPADCNPGEVCCLNQVWSPPPIVGSTCTRAEYCVGNDSLACSSSADCGDGGAATCVAQSCGGDVLESCGFILRGECH